MRTIVLYCLKLHKINLFMELPAGLTVVGLTVVAFGVVGFGFGVVASKSIIRMILFFEFSMCIMIYQKSFGCL